jgi:hypothetical protein
MIQFRKGFLHFENVEEVSVVSVQEMPEGSEAPIPATAPLFVTSLHEIIVVESMAIITIFAVVLGLRRREI